LKLNGIHQILVYADDVNTRILGGSVYTTNKNGESVVVARKENGIEVHADNTKYMVMQFDQKAGRCHSMKIDNSSFERVEDFKY
jgi:hypothetical protein